MKDSSIYYKELKEIIDVEDLEKLIVYITTIPKEDYGIIKSIIEYNPELSLRKYYQESIHIKKLQWKMRGSNTQISMISLVFLAIAQEKEILQWGVPNQYLITNENRTYTTNFDKYFIEILSNRRGKWINKWFTKMRWGAPPYVTLERLLNLGIIQHDKQLFANSLVNITTLPIHLENFPTYEYIRNNQFLIENDLLSIFDFEIGFLWEGNNTAVKIYWAEIFQKLIDEGIFSKELILKKCIEASKHNFNKNFLKQYRDLFIILKPTIDEKIALQHELFELFNQPLAANVNFAIDQIKTITEQKGFDIEAFLLNTESILPRNDLKTGIKAILSICEKIAKKQPDFSAQICMLVTNCLISTESSIQEKAAKIIKNFGNKNDEMLLASISIYTEQINKTTLEFLQDFISVDNQPNTSNENIEYHYIPQTFPKSTKGKPVEYISNWNDLLFQVGKALKSTDPIDAELLFDGIIRLQNQFPANYKDQLEPFLKQAKSLGWNSNVGILHGMIGRFIERWVINFENETNEQYFNYFKFNDSFIGLYFLRIRYVGKKNKKGSILPLLSTPTHAPFWVSSEVLVDRLLDYQEANELIDDLDFLLAITRIMVAVDENIIAKTHKLNGYVKDIILYLLTNNQDLTINKSSFVKSSTQTIIKFFTKFGGGIQLTEDEKQALFWAIVARTKKSEGIYSELEITTLKDYPNVIIPYQLSWEVKEIKQKQQWSNKILTENKIILNHHNSAIHIRNLVYSSGYYFKQNSQGYMPADTNFIYSFIPNFTEPFYFRMLDVYAIKSDLTADTQKKGFHESLKTLLIYKPNIDKSANLFLATGFLSNTPMNRDLSVEIFIQSVIEQRLDVKQLGQNIGKLLAGNYAPIQRLSDSLLSLKNISAINDISLILFFENMLIEFSDELPKGFAKLLEFYNELLLNYNRKVCIEVELKLNRWQENTTLKKQLIKMKGLIR